MSTKLVVVCCTPLLNINAVLPKWPCLSVKISKKCDLHSNVWIMWSITSMIMVNLIEFDDPGADETGHMLGLGAQAWCRWVSLPCLLWGYRIRGTFHWEDFITVNRIRYISEAYIQKKQLVLLVIAGNWFQRSWLPYVMSWLCWEIVYFQQPTQLLHCFAVN